MSTESFVVCSSMERVNRGWLVDIFSITRVRGYQMKAVGVESKANKRRWWFIPEVVDL